MDTVVVARQFTVDNRNTRSVLKKNNKRKSATLPATFYTIRVEQPAVVPTKKGVHFPVSVLLQQAITEGDRKEINQLLKDYGNMVVEEREPSGLPPVMRAVFEGQLECLKMLVQAGAELTATDPEGWNVLHVAAAMDDMEAAKFVTQACNEQLTQVRNVDGQRPIDLAESPDVARFLLYADLQDMRLNATTNSKDSESTNESQLLQTVREHYEANADCDFLNVMLQSQTEFDSILHLAAAKNFPRLAYYTLKHQIVDSNSRDRIGWTPLHVAAYYGSVDVLLLLIEFGASIHSITNSYEKSSDLSDHDLILDILTEEEGL